MAKFRITSPDGAVFEITAPDDATPEQVQAFVQKHVPAAPKEEPGFFSNLAGGVVKSVQDRVLAAEQRGAEGYQDPRRLSTPSLMETAAYFAKGRRPAAEIQAEVDARAAEAAQQPTTAGGVIGGVLPDVAMGVVTGGRSAAATTAPRVAAAALPRIARAVGTGAIVGGVQGAVSGMDRATQTGETRGENAARGGVVGAATGAVLTPVIAELGGAIGKGIAALRGRFNAKSDAQVQAQANKLVDDWIASKAADDGFDLSQIPKGILDNARQQAAQALRTGQQLDPAALVRKADFEAVGVQPTLGQVTRDPMQFAKERNLRGVNIGGGQNPLAARLSEQNNALAQRINTLGASNAVEPDVAGNALIKALQAYDKPRQQAVTAAYDTARAAAGRNANVPTNALAQRFGQVVDDFGPENVPSAVRARMEAFGFGGTQQTKAYTVEEADKLLKVINANYDPSKRAQAAALDQLRGAVQGSIDDLAGAGDAIGTQAAQAFGQARQQAAERFKSLDATPALRAALDGAEPDTFVRRYVLNGSTNELQALRKAVAADPNAMGSVRAQIAGYLRDKAFGTNAAGDANFAQASYNKALRDLGTNKLQAFFTPEEVAQMQAVGRVAGYINAQPAGSAVNNSNTASAAMNLLSDLSGRVGSYPGLNVLRDSFRNFQNERAAQNALAAQLTPDAISGAPQFANAWRGLGASGAVAGGSIGGR